MAAGGLDLQPRISIAAATMLTLVLRIIDDTSLLEGKDRRGTDSHTAPPFRSREETRMLSLVHPTDVSACTTLALRLPSKLKILAYLADINRLNTWANLHYKKCAPSVVCAACPILETGRHLLFDRPHATAIRRQLGGLHPGGAVLSGSRVGAT
jgi:hypothetical protein